MLKRRACSHFGCLVRRHGTNIHPPISNGGLHWGPKWLKRCPQRQGAEKAYMFRCSAGAGVSGASSIVGNRDPIAVSGIVACLGYLDW
jgi:hypothetical protein